MRAFLAAIAALVLSATASIGLERDDIAKTSLAYNLTSYAAFGHVRCDDGKWCNATAAGFFFGNRTMRPVAFTPQCDVYDRQHVKLSTVDFLEITLPPQGHATTFNIIRGAFVNDIALIDCSYTSFEFVR